MEQRPHVEVVDKLTSKRRALKASVSTPQWILSHLLVLPIQTSIAVFIRIRTRESQRSAMATRTVALPIAIPNIPQFRQLILKLTVGLARRSRSAVELSAAIVLNPPPTQILPKGKDSAVTSG